MIYLIVKILVLLILAGLIGALIGWFFRGVRDGERIEAQQSENTARLHALRSERNAAEAKLQALAATSTADADAGRRADAAEQAAADAAAALAAAKAETEAAESRATALAAELAAAKQSGADAEAAAVQRAEAAEAALADCQAEVASLAAAAETPAQPASPVLQALLAEPEPEPYVEQAAEPEPEPENAAEDDPADEQAPQPMEEPADGGDDLRRISGVGPKIEGLLHEMGIWRYSQIAAFTPAEVAWVDERLRFKGRIDREDWIGQAKAFAAEAD